MEKSRRKADAVLMSFSAWMADRRPRPLRQATRAQYVRWIKRAMALAADQGKSLMAADTRTLRFLLGQVPVHPASQNGMTHAFRVFFAFLKDQGIRKDNPALELGMAPKLRTAPRPMSLDDAMKYLDAAWSLGPEHYMIATLGLYMGLRQNEIRTRKWRDFFEADGRLWCDIDGKGGKHRREPVHSQVGEAMRMLRNTHRDPTWLFPSPVAARSGEPASPVWVLRRHHAILDAAGLPYTRLHDLRHTFATYLRRRAGADIQVVQQALGHASSSTTEVYVQILPSEVADAVDRLDFRRKEKDGEPDDQGEAG